MKPSSHAARCPVQRDGTVDGSPIAAWVVMYSSDHVPAKRWCRTTSRADLHRSRLPSAPGSLHKESKSASRCRCFRSIKATSGSLCFPMRAKSSRSQTFYSWGLTGAFCQGREERFVLGRQVCLFSWQTRQAWPLGPQGSLPCRISWPSVCGGHKRDYGAGAPCLTNI